MKTLKFFLFSTIIATFSCTKEPNDKPVDEQEPLPIELSEKSADVISSMNLFGFDIFRLLVADEPEIQNIFISPTSISLALAMTLNGANTDTEEAMKTAIRMNNVTMDAVNETFRDLMEALKTCDEKVLLEIANSIWYKYGFNVEQGFLTINMEYYQAEVTELDFADPASVDVINGWVADKTHDKITEIIEEISPETVMFLINAIYFKGIWTTQFDPEDTYQSSFNLSNGGIKQVDMMRLKDTLKYYENDEFQAVELDYGRGNFAMTVLLPKGENTADDLADAMNPELWDGWMSSFSEFEVDLSLPKFSFGYEKELNDILTAMGMGIAFSAEADLSGIRQSGGLQISMVKHKTFVEVNEEGTEAAAVTIVEIIETSAPTDTRYMTVNKPFLFTIREKTTNTVVFMGKVAEPVEE